MNLLERQMHVDEVAHRKSFIADKHFFHRFFIEFVLTCFVMSGLSCQSKPSSHHSSDSHDFQAGYKDQAVTCTGGQCVQSFIKVIAHRGASGHLPEHTLPAKALAYGMGADYLEQDVVMTKDNELIVLHDIHLDTVTDAAKRFPARKRADGRYYVIDFTLAEIMTLNVNERVDLKNGQAVFPSRFPTRNTGYRVSTLKQEIEMIQSLNQSTGRSVGLYIEYKAPAWHAKEGRDIVAKLMEVLNTYGLYKAQTSQNAQNAQNALGSPPILIQCFDPVSLENLFKKYQPNIPLIQLIADNSWNESEADYDQMMTTDGMKKISTYAAGIGPWIPQILGAFDAEQQIKRGSFLESAHNLNLEIHPYTFRLDALPDGFQSKDVLLQTLFQKAKVTGIFADQPEAVLHFLGRR